MRGIATDVQLRNVSVLDSKSTGVLIMRKGGFSDLAEVSWDGGLLAGQSSDGVCSACPALGATGCHPKISRVSNNRVMPFSPSVGLQSSIFAMDFSPGLDVRPYEWVEKGWQMIHGRMTVSNVTVADFLGANGCGGSAVGTYALSNSLGAPDAAHPHSFSRMNVVNVATG